MKDIINEQDVAHLLDIFYERIREHDELGPIFNDDIGALWELHMDTLNRFWCTLLFEGQSYFGNPFSRHTHLPIKDHHFDQWLELFICTVDELYAGEKADEAKKRALSFANSFRNKFSKLDKPTSKAPFFKSLFSRFRISSYLKSNRAIT
ncbi:MAG: group III truncated hemoglobin [Pseudomonadales bacterium]|nr:group III truncated hemoglobin [Pseudomonadales bacterium]